MGKLFPKVRRLPPALFFQACLQFGPTQAPHQFILWGAIEVCPDITEEMKLTNIVRHIGQGLFARPRYGVTQIVQNPAGLSIPRGRLTKTRTNVLTIFRGDFPTIQQNGTA